MRNQREQPAPTIAKPKFKVICEEFEGEMLGIRLKQSDVYMKTDKEVIEYSGITHSIIINKPIKYLKIRGDLVLNPTKGPNDPDIYK